MTCPNCGQVYEGSRCPNCGRPNDRKWRRVAAIVVLIFAVLPSAAAGACSIVMGGGMALAPHGWADGYWILSAIIFLIAASLFIGAVHIMKKLWRG